MNTVLSGTGATTKPPRAGAGTLFRDGDSSGSKVITGGTTPGTYLGIQGGIIISGGTLVLDYTQNSPVRILDTANTLIRGSGCKDIDIIYSGLRPGEKISEDLFSASEYRRATTNPLVTSVEVPTLSIEDVQSAELDNHKAAAVWMRQQSVPSSMSGA